MRFYRESYYSDDELRELLGDEIFELLCLPAGVPSHSGRQVLSALDAMKYKQSRRTETSAVH